MAKQLRDLGWMKADSCDRIDNYIDFAFLAKATVSGSAIDMVARVR
jgi:hypothetical protein